MSNCAVNGCRSYSRMKNKGDIKFYSFPKDEALCARWVHACGRQDTINLKNARICSKHFEPSCFFTSLQYELLNEPAPKRFRNIQCNAFPTLFLPREPSWMKREEDLQHTRTAPLEFVSASLTENEDISMNFTGKLHQELAEAKDKINRLETEMKSLKKENVDLENENRKLTANLSHYESTLKSFFSSGQIKRILNPTKKKANWSVNDIASAISLQSVSPRAYRYLKQNGYPLPALCTLRRRASSLNE